MNSINRAHAGHAQLIGKLNNQNTVFGDQAHQCDEANLAVNIQSTARPFQCQKRTHHRQRHGQQNHKGIDKAFELRGQDQKDKHQGQHKHAAERTGRLNKLTRIAVDIGGVTGLEYFASDAFHEGQSLTQRIGRRQIGGEGDTAALGKVIKFPWHHHLFHLHQGRQRHHGVSTPANKNFLDIHGCIAVLGFGLHHHVVLLATTLVLGNAAPAHGGFHRTCNNVYRNTQVGRTLAVYLQADLGFVQTQVHIHADDAWVFSHFILNSLGDFG